MDTNDKTIESKESVIIADNKTKIKDFFSSENKRIKIVIVVLGVFLLMLISFAVGISVGSHKAMFSSRFGENYERNFMGMRPDRLPPVEFMNQKVKEFEGRGLRNGHGIAGTIISVSDGSIVIKDRGDKENTVSVNDKTIINQGRNSIKIEDLKIDQEIVVIGKPGDSGVVNADLIRVFNNGVNNQ